MLELKYDQFEIVSLSICDIDKKFGLVGIGMYRDVHQPRLKLQPGLCKYPQQYTYETITYLPTCTVEIGLDKFDSY